MIKEVLASSIKNTVGSFNQTEVHASLNGLLSRARPPLIAARPEEVVGVDDSTCARMSKTIA